MEPAPTSDADLIAGAVATAVPPPTTTTTTTTATTTTIRPAGMGISPSTAPTGA